MTTAQAIGYGVTACAWLGFLAGTVQRSTSGRTQRIAAALAAIFIDTRKLVDAIRGETADAAIMTKDEPAKEEAKS